MADSVCANCGQDVDETDFFCDEVRATNNGRLIEIFSTDDDNENISEANVCLFPSEARDLAAWLLNAALEMDGE